MTLNIKVWDKIFIGQDEKEKIAAGPDGIVM